MHFNTLLKGLQSRKPKFIRVTRCERLVVSLSANCRFREEP